MPIYVDLEGVKTGFALVPDGTYMARLTKVTFGESKTHNPKVTLELTFNEDQGEEVAGRKAFIDYSLQPKALFGVKGALINLGYDPEALESSRFDIEGAFTELMASSQVEAAIRVGHREYDGKDFNRFEIVEPSNSWGS